MSTCLYTVYIDHTFNMPIFIVWFSLHFQLHFIGHIGSLETFLGQDALEADKAGRSPL